MSIIHCTCKCIAFKVHWSYVDWVILQSLLLRMVKNGDTRLSERLVNRGFNLFWIQTSTSWFVMFRLDRLALSNICLISAAFTSWVREMFWTGENDIIRTLAMFWTFYITLFSMNVLCAPAHSGKRGQRKQEAGNPSLAAWHWWCFVDHLLPEYWQKAQIVVLDSVEVEPPSKSTNKTTVKMFFTMRNSA